MKKLEIVMEMVAHGFQLWKETPEQFAARFSLEQLEFMREQFLFYAGVLSREIPPGRLENPTKNSRKNF